MDVGGDGATAAEGAQTPGVFGRDSVQRERFRVLLLKAVRRASGQIICDTGDAHEEQEEHEHYVEHEERVE